MEITVKLCFLSAGFAGALALAVALRAGRSLPRWLFVAGMLCLVAGNIFSGLSVDSVLLDEKADWETWRLLALSCLPGIWFLFSLSYARGDSDILLARWKVWLIAGGAAPLALAVIFRERMLAFVSPLGGEMSETLHLATAGTALYMIILISAVAALMNLERTYRASVGTMRWRIKFMILGLGVLLVAQAYTSAQVLIFHALNPRMHAVDAGALVLAGLLIARTLSRTGHFEVSVYPSRAVLQSSATVLLAGIYLVLVGALAKAISVLPGKTPFEFRAFGVLLALVTLAMLLMSDRVRLLTRRFVSRHFQRPLHDYPHVWRSFTAATARCMEPSAFCDGLARVISDIFLALSVSVWLLDETRTRLTFAASTSLFKPTGGELDISAEDTAQMLATLCGHPEPVNIDRSRESWAAALRNLQPEQFRRGGHRLCVGLTAGKDLLGIVMVGDRVGAAPYEVLDLELLKTMAEQAGASILNLQLTEKLAQAKQLEAFQAMAAFFVHDLKNTTSTLSLMLKNLPVHFQDPAFREEAVMDIARTAKQLEELISRLNMVRQELKVPSVACDLNQLVNDALKGQESVPGVELVKELKPLPELCLDPAQIRTLVTNLLLNAREAVGGQGRILVETGRFNGWATLAVSDNGCGMAEEFLRQRLFRPFQTTKKNGIGIGMFHCKMIVEAHHGRIDVESEKGKGTCFRISLPVPQ
jgi:putative PEP-CTERM system histidine kinase